MNKNDLKIIEHIGKGKSGNSYLCEFRSSKVVLKEMHDEKVPYYNFTKSKIEHELEAYQLLDRIGVRIPRLLSHSVADNYLIKEYVAGKTATELVVENSIRDDHLLKMMKIENICKSNDINIDYFPSNFVYNGHEWFYVDYEFNTYSDEWNFRNWGIFYWLNSDGMRLFSASGESDKINEPGTGIPKKTADLEERRNKILERLYS